VRDQDIPIYDGQDQIFSPSDFSSDVSSQDSFDSFILIEENMQYKEKVTKEKAQEISYVELR
jgi:hypothetical protein